MAELYDVKYEQQKLQREKKMRMQRYFDLEKLKITDLDSYKKSKGLVDIDDPYMGAPLTVYEHTLPHNPPNKRKLLFKYSDQIRGKQWDVSDIYQKQLGFNKWMEPLGISAFATVLAASTSVPPLVLPIAAVGAIAVSGNNDKVSKLKDDIVSSIKEKKKKRNDKKKERKEEVARAKASAAYQAELIKAADDALLRDIHDSINSNPSYYLSTIPHDIGLDRIILDVYERGNVEIIERAKDINITSLKEYVEHQRGRRKVKGYRDPARVFYDKVKKEYEDKWAMGRFDIDGDAEDLKKYIKWVNLKNKQLPEIWKDALDITRQQKENDTKEAGLIEFLKKVEKVPDTQTFEEFVKPRDVDGFIEGWIDTFNEARLINELPRIEMEIMHTNPSDFMGPKVRAIVGGKTGTIFPGAPGSGGGYKKNTRRRKVRIHKKNTRRVYK